jgi:uncharacterized protein
MLTVTAIYAAVFAVFAVILGSRVGALRLRTNVSLGDGGNADLIVANRRHLNFLENVPMILIMMACLELNGASATWLHGLGGALFVARVIHPLGLEVENMRRPARFAGATLTLLVTLTAAGKLLWMAFGSN